MLPMSTVQGIHGPPSPSTCKDKIVVGDTLLSFGYYEDESRFSLGHSFELEGFLNRQKTGKGLVNTTIMFILDSVESME